MILTVSNPFLSWFFFFLLKLYSIFLKRQGEGGRVNRPFSGHCIPLLDGSNMAFLTINFIHCLDGMVCHIALFVSYFREMSFFYKKNSLFDFKSSKEVQVSLFHGLLPVWWFKLKIKDMDKMLLKEITPEMKGRPANWYQFPHEIWFCLRLIIDLSASAVPLFYHFLLQSILPDI